MQSLDPHTLEGIAEVICGDDTDWYRKGYQLSEFFKRANVQHPEHDGSTRKWWTLQQLTEINQDPDEIAKVLLRLADPREYRGKSTLVTAVVREVNELLSIEGIEVRLDGITPTLVELTPTMTKPTPPTFVPKDPPDFGRLTSDVTLEAVLTNRWLEAQRCVDADAHIAAIILMGSLLEGALLSVALKNVSTAVQASASPKDPKTTKAKQPYDWTLSSLIDVAHECGWIEQDAKQFSHVLRGFRNMIHPWEQAKMSYLPDEDTCVICWEVVRAALNDLAKA